VRVPVPRADIAAWIDVVFEAHPHEVARLRAGEHRLVDFFVGRVLAISGGRADPIDARRMIAERSASAWGANGGVSAT
jgi:Asp-tRNA(Asn)/Glu-tRNA(Gln) amidotransferase B subunit